MAFELKLAQYSGPLEKLLNLIEERKLEITEISLAAVTDDFLKYLETLRQEIREDDARLDLRLIADFIVVASRLIFIKSKSLLPDLSLTQEEEADIKDLEDRLKLYQELRPAMKLIAKLWREDAMAHSRPYFLNMAHWLIPRPTASATYPLAQLEQGRDVKFFYPGRNAAVDPLHVALSRMFAGLKVLVKEGEVIQEKIVTLEQKINEIVARVREIQETSFRRLSESQNRSEIIVTFLAILHLAREQLIFLEQTGHLSDIIIKKNNVS